MQASSFDSPSAVLPRDLPRVTNANLAPLAAPLNSSVRILAGDSCGSGACVAIVDGPDGQGEQWILSNAHVTGTVIGSSPIVEAFTEPTRKVSKRGTLAYAAYEPGSDIDFSFVVLRGSQMIPGLVAHPLDCEGVWLAGDRAWTGGSPNCIETVYRIVQSLPNSSRPIIDYSPAAISGQSGSGIFLYGLTVGLTTWTNGRVGFAQSSDWIYEAVYGASSIASDLPDGCRQAIEIPHPNCDRCEASDGADVIPDEVWACNIHGIIDDPEPESIYVLTRRGEDGAETWRDAELLVRAIVED